MNFNMFGIMLAAAPVETEPNPTAKTILGGVWIAMMVGMVYFMILRPQQKRTKDLNNLLKGLKTGDKIVTTSGIIGTVVSVKDRSISLRSAETKLEILKSAVAEVTERATEGSAT